MVGLKKALYKVKGIQGRIMNSIIQENLMMDMQSQTEQIERLRSALDDNFRKTGSRVIRSADEQRIYAELAYKYFSTTLDMPEILRKARFLSAFANEFPVSVEEDELIVGSQRFTGPNFAGILGEDKTRIMGFRGNIGHIIVGYGRVLSEGICGLRERIEKMNPRDEIIERNYRAFEETLESFSIFIKRHSDYARLIAESCSEVGRKQQLYQIAENCECIAENPPHTFWEALQLVWFMQIFLHAESNNAAISFGRFDQYMWHFLESDLHNEILTMESAEKLLACFWLKCCEGDESQNLIVGGVDTEGSNAENPLSLLCLKVARELIVWQPSVSVRISPDTSDSFWQASLELCAAGFGMPSFFNDPVVISALKALDIPSNRARDWGIVGCYEATPQGDTYGLTVGSGFVLPNVLLDFLNTEIEALTFDELYQKFQSFFAEYYIQQLKGYQNHWDNLRNNCASPFESICLTGCIESGLAVEEGGGRFNLFGLNILGLGTLIDSLLVLKNLFYDRQKLSLQEMQKQLKENFPDESLLMLCRNLDGKYGSDSEYSNKLAEELSGYITDIVINSRLENSVRPYPGFFRFLADVYMPLPATPDGRRENDRISYGAGPGVFCKDSTPTTIVNSVSHVAHDRSACGNPLMLSFNQSDIKGEGGLQRLRQVIETYFQKGGFHLHINMIDPSQLRAAQENPMEYSHFIVKVSGYSARFTALDKRLQDAIIERTEKGM
jgi:pyruvate-formate lyase